MLSDAETNSSVRLAVMYSAARAARSSAFSIAARVRHRASPRGRGAGGSPGLVPPAGNLARDRDEDL